MYLTIVAIFIRGVLVLNFVISRSKIKFLLQFVDGMYIKGDPLVIP